MAYMLMTAEDLLEVGIGKQESGFLNKITGEFTKSGWNFIEEKIEDNYSTFIAKFISDSMDVIYIISYKTENADMDLTFSSYNFYKEGI